MSGGIGNFVIGTSPIGGGSDGGIGMLSGNVIRLAMLNSGGVGIDKTIYAEEMYVALNMLSGLIAQWQRRRWMVWSLVDTACISTGQQSYTIGTGGNFNVARPDKIESAFARLLVLAGTQTTGPLTSNGGAVMLPPGSTLPTNPTGLPPGSYWNNGGFLMVTPGAPFGSAGTTTPLFLDYHLQIVEAREDYNKIGLKGLMTFPTALFYDSAYPMGNVYIWPIPQAQQFELHVTTKTTISQAITLTTTLIMPPEYQQALVYTLACMLRPTYGMGPDPTLLGQARAAMATVRAANAQVGVLEMPAALLPHGRGGLAASSSPGFQSGGQVW